MRNHEVKGGKRKDSTMYQDVVSLPVFFFCFGPLFIHCLRCFPCIRISYLVLIIVCVLLAFVFLTLVDS